MKEELIEVVEDEVVSDSHIEDKKVLHDFIKTYESLPELWNPKHPLYINKSKRRLAMDKLVKIYEKKKQGATIVDVRKKINTLRCNYRKELQKINATKNYVNVYVPKSWVFYALQFLDNCEQPVNAKIKKVNETNQSDFKLKSEPPSTSPTPTASRSSTLRLPPPPVSPRKRRNIGKPTVNSTDLLRKACEVLIKSNEKIPSIAKAWGERLNSLECKQRLFAEKAINDVLFEAQLGNLNRNSVKINEDSWSNYSSDASNN